MYTEEIEKYLLEEIEKAFNNNETEYTIKAYDLYKKFDLKGEVPNACNAMRRVSKKYNYLLRYSSPSGYSTKYCITYYKGEVPKLDIKQEFYEWFKKQPQLNYPDKKYAEETMLGAIKLLESGCASVYDKDIEGYRDLNIFAVDNYKDFNNIYENLFPYAENFDKSGGHRDFRNGLDFYKKFLGEREGIVMDKLTSTNEEKEEIKMTSIKKDKGISKNTILFGPPGTGKTYNTVIYAVAIIEKKTIEEVKKEAKDNYREVLARYNDYKKDRQIDFVTFHQSYGYEEFIEGIKPVVDEENDTVKYAVENGIFKEFCDNAVTKKAVEDNKDIGLNDSPTIWKVSLEHTGDNPTRTECLRNGYIRVGYDLYGENIDALEGKKYPGKQILEAYYNQMQVGDIIVSCYNYTTTDAIGVVTGEEVEWHDEFNHLKRLRKVKWLVKEIKENVLEINNNKKFTTGTIYKLNIQLDDILNIVKKYNKKQSIAKEEDKNYVFIIDEINRGNISKIFGELITLIEDTKRKGANEAMSVTLPYSKTQFSVPNNVYILGTMNTADRSIAHLDTALRRRFDFEEMMPNSKLLNNIRVDEIDIEKMLSVINRRIVALYDREHTIGHAYFMSLKDNPTMDNLANIFKNKVIPLLQEYFFDDYEKIRLVLGDNSKEENEFIVKTENVASDLFYGNTDLDIEDSYTYTINAEAFYNKDSYLGIYQSVEVK